MIDCILDFIDEFKGFLLTFILLMSIGFGLAYFLERAKCNAKTENFESRFGVFTGCQVEVNDRWVDWDNFRVTDEEE